MAAEEKQEKKAQKEEDMTIPEETYMTSGAHIGTRQKTADIYAVEIYYYRLKVSDAATNGKMAKLK